LRTKWLAVAISCAALVVPLSACGGDDDGDGGGQRISGDTLTIYSSLPLQGASREQSEAVINGERLALQQLAPGNRLGRFRIRYVSLDDSTAQNPGTADEGQTAQNARRAASDRTTIFYLGEFNSGGSKVSIPILNKAGIPQISPANTYVGLTTNEPGSEPGEPRKYYPSGERSYARVVPRDTIQGAAMVATMREDGCRTVTLWNDGTTYGAGLARNIELSAQRAGLRIENKQRTDRNAPNYRSLAANIRSDCFVWSGVTGENGVQVFKDAAAACPRCRLYGPDGTAEEAFTNPAKGGIPASIGNRTKVFVATLDPRDLPASRPVVAAFGREYGDRSPDPYAIYGYETMALALDVLKRAGADANDRQRVIDVLFQTRNRSSVLGTYSIDENGDTTLTDYGLYTIENGQPTYQKKITSDPRLIPTA
jgi:branched-chain amino acid transport system substrate-binding protein